MPEIILLGGEHDGKIRSVPALLEYYRIDSGFISWKYGTPPIVKVSLYRRTNEVNDSGHIIYRIEEDR